MAQATALLADIEGLVRATRGSHCQWTVRMSVDAFLPPLEPQPVDRSGPRLIHDPSDDRTAGRIVGRRPSPHIVEHIECHFFSGGPIARDTDGKCEHESMRLLVEQTHRLVFTFTVRCVCSTSRRIDSCSHLPSESM